MAIRMSYAEAKDLLILEGDGPPLPDATISPISSIKLTKDGIRLEMPIAVFRRVGVEYSPDGSSGSWIELGNFSEAGDMMVFDDPDPVRRARSRGFYRAFLRPFSEAADLF